MGPKRVVIELYGEYTGMDEQVCGIWVGFHGSWRPDALWRDVEALVQTLQDFRKDGPEITVERLRSLELGESIRCDDLFDFEALNALGSPFDWELRRSPELPPDKLPGTGSE